MSVPKGEHHVAALLAVCARLLQLGAAAKHTASPLTGPVVHVSGKVGLLDRLKSVSVRSVSLAEGLKPKAIRRDGGLRALDATTSTPDTAEIRASAGALWHLSTRSGWPAVPIHGGATIIDGPSMSVNAVRAAIRWAQDNGAEVITVVDDLGAAIGAEALTAGGVDGHVTLAWTPTLVTEACEHLGTTGEPTPLSTNALLRIGRTCDLDVVQVAHPDDAAVMLDGIRALAASLRNRPVGEVPAALAAARALINGSARLVSTRHTYDLHAASHRRARPLRSARLAVEAARASDFTGPWHTIGQGAWARIKQAALACYDCVDAHAARFDAVLHAAARARGAYPDAHVAMLAPTRIAADALREDISRAAASGQLDEKIAGPLVEAADATMSVVASGQRREFDAHGQVVEVLAAPDLFESSQLLSAEATVARYAVTWPHETRRLAALLEATCNEQDRANQATFAILGLGEYPDGPAPTVRTVRHAPAPLGEAGDGPGVELATADIELITAVFGDEDVDDSASFEDHCPADDRLVTVRPVYVQPGAVWYADVEDVGVVRGDEYRTTPVDELAAGDTVLVPAPGTYGDLFTRMVAARHRHSDVASLDIVLRSWTRGIAKALQACGGNVAELHRRLAAEGIELSYQAIRFWVEGRTMAASSADAIAAVGRIANDPALVDNARRIAAIADELRVVHRQLGRIVHKAVEQAVSGGGAHLRTLSEVVDDFEVGEVLDEFEQRIVTGTSPPISVPRSLSGAIESQ